MNKINIQTVLATLAIIALGNKFSREFKQTLDGRF